MASCPLGRITNRSGLWAWSPAEGTGQLSTAQVPEPAVAAILSNSNNEPKIDFTVLKYPQDSSQAASGEPLLAHTEFISPLSSAGSCIEWTGPTENLSMGGLYVAGKDGSLTLFNPSALFGVLVKNAVKQNLNISSGLRTPVDYALVSRCSSATADGEGIAAVAIDGTQIAVGSAQDKISFIDPQTFSKPTNVFSPELGALTSMAWHPQTQGVCLVGGYDGLAVVNPKMRQKLITMIDPGKRQNVSGLGWLESGRSVVVSYDDPQKGGLLQIWDLRHTNYPLKEFKNQHSAGILGIKKTHSDPRFLVSCHWHFLVATLLSPSHSTVCVLFQTTASREGKVVTWCSSGASLIPYSEVMTGEEISTFSVTSAGSMGLVQTETDRGVSSFWSVDSNLCRDSASSTSASSTVSCKTTPKWLPSGNGCDFGFGGRSAWYTESANEDVCGISTIYADDVFMEAVNQFEPYFASGDFAGYCHLKASETESTLESQIWTLLETSYLPVQNRAERFLSALNYSLPHIQSQVETQLGHPGGASLLMPTEAIPDLSAERHRGEEGLQSPVDAHFDSDSFFRKLVHEQPEPKPTPNAASATQEVQNTYTGPGYFVSTGPELWNSDSMRLMQTAFVTGQPLTAIELAIQGNHLALAFMLAASLNDATVLAAVRRAFLRVNEDPFIATMANTCEQNFAEIVANADLEKWREIAAILVTYPFRAEVEKAGTYRQFTELCKMLAYRLHQEQGDHEAALLVYIMSGSFTEACELLASIPGGVAGAGTRALKIWILQHLDPSMILDSSAASLVHRFVCRLVEAGQVQLANLMLNLVGGKESKSVSLLKFMVAEYTGSQAPVPLETYDVQPSPSLLQMQQQQAFEQQASYNARPGQFGNQFGQTSTFAPQQPPLTPFQQSGPMQGGSMQQGGNRPPQTGFAPPQSSFAPPVSSFAPPPAFNASPTAGTFAPPATFAAPAPSSSFAPPQSGFNAQSRAPPATFAPPPAATFAPNKTLPPPAGSFAPPPQFNQPPAQSGFNQPTNFYNQPPPAMGTGINMGQEKMQTTHPAASSYHLPPSMPTPWPLPTSAQRVRSFTQQF